MSTLWSPCSLALSAQKHSTCMLALYQKFVRCIPARSLVHYTCVQYPTAETVRRDPNSLIYRQYTGKVLEASQWVWRLLEPQLQAPTANVRLYFHRSLRV